MIEAMQPIETDSTGREHILQGIRLERVTDNGFRTLIDGIQRRNDYLEWDFEN